MGKRVEVKTGDKYGRLTVIEEVEPHITSGGNKIRRVKCKCDCCNEVEVVTTLNSLRTGRTLSCGCLQKERISEINSKTKAKTNEYDLSGDIGIGHTSSGDVFYFDKEDFELIKNYCWCINDYGYVVTIDRITRKTVQFHRLVMHPGKEDVVDHINHDKLNNCKSNLRVCSHVDNMKNRSIKKYSVSGFTGVTWHKKSSKWQAQIKVNGRNIHLGFFTDINEAVKARIMAELEIFGEFSANYNYFTEEQRQAILNNKISSEEIVKLLNQKSVDKQYPACYNKDK